MKPGVLRGPNYLTMSTLAQKLDYQDSEAAKKWARERGLALFARSSKVWLVREDDVDRALRGETVTR